MKQRFSLFFCLLMGIWLAACQSDNSGGGGDGGEPVTTDTTSNGNSTNPPKPKANTKVPKRRDLMNSSTHLNQFEISPARASEILVEFASVPNDEADIHLKLLTKNRFHLEILLLEDDFPLTLVGGYGEEDGAYILQFTDSELAKKIFGEGYNADSNVQMLSASEVSFSQATQSINIWGIVCDKK